MQKLKQFSIIILILAALMASITYAFNSYHNNQVYLAQQAYYHDQLDQCQTAVDTQYQATSTLGVSGTSSLDSMSNKIVSDVLAKMKNPDYIKASDQCSQQWGKYITDGQ